MNNTDTAEILQQFNTLFLHTDAKRWKDAQALFVAEPMHVDMTSLVGGSPVSMTPADLFAGFAIGLHAGKISHHMTSNAIVSGSADAATVTAHGYALNWVPALPDGENLWETWGEYVIGAVRTAEGWRLSSFVYRSRLTRGPDAVRTHTP